MKQGVFYIAGCQRSGTTLLRLILGTHPQIYCFDETEGYKLLPKLKATSAADFNLQKKAQILGFKVPRFTEQLLADRIRDPDYGEFPAFYSFEPVLFLIRDVRDVVSSMKLLKYSDGGSWLEKYGRSILDFKLEDPKFVKLYRKETELLRAWKYKDSAVGAFYWKYKTNAIFDLFAAKAPVLGISYELLVDNPRELLSRALSFLGLRWSENVLHHQDFEHTELEPDGRAIGGTNPSSVLNRSSIGRYRQILTDEDEDAIMAIVGDTRERSTKLLE